MNPEIKRHQVSPLPHLTYVSVRERRSPTRCDSSRTSSAPLRLAQWSEAVVEISKAVQVHTEEDAVYVAIGHPQQDGREPTAVRGEHQRRPSVELALLDVERRATGRRRHEGGDAPRALERRLRLRRPLNTRPSGPPPVIMTASAASRSASAATSPAEAAPRKAYPPDADAPRARR